MFPLMTELPLTPAQVVAATRLMLHVAHIDGARTDEEVALIRQFYDSFRAGTPSIPEFNSLDASHEKTSAQDFPDPGHRDMLLALCLMVAYADGELSAAESAAVNEAAARLEVAEAHVNEILAQVKDFMLSQLARLPDTASVAAVAKELG